MTDTTRYDPSEFAGLQGMVKSDYGEYVRFDDYAAAITRAEAAEADWGETVSFYKLFHEHRVKLEAERDALQAKLAMAVEALKECQGELDQYSQNEYPSDHPLHVRYRKRDHESNPARIALAKLTEDTPKEEHKIITGMRQALEHAEANTSPPPPETDPCPPHAQRREKWTPKQKTK